MCCCDGVIGLIQLMASVKDCFVTGKWQACEDAETLLEEDGVWIHVLPLIMEGCICMRSKLLLMFGVWIDIHI